MSEKSVADLIGQKQGVDLVSQKPSPPSTGDPIPNASCAAWKWQKSAKGGI